MVPLYLEYPNFFSIVISCGNAAKRNDCTAMDIHTLIRKEAFADKFAGYIFVLYFLHLAQWCHHLDGGRNETQ